MCKSGNKNMKELDVGCGNRKVNGAIGIDIANLPNVDIVQDLNILPWGDLKAGSFDTIYMLSVLEHLDDPIKIIGECYRLLKRGGRLHLTVAYWNHKNTWSDPQHKHAFTEIYFKFFIGKQRPYYMDYKFRKLNIKYLFDGKAKRVFGNDEKILLEKGHFNCNIISGMKIDLVK